MIAKDDPRHGSRASYDWHAAWRDGRIGFHRDRVGAELLEERWLPAEPQRILVPLCGKSLDLLWLVERGHEVVGVELVEQAVQEFHRENQRPFQVRERPPFRAYESERLTILVGDFFALDESHAGPFDAVYDRAALIALGPETRPAYAERVWATLRAGGRMLLSTCTYDESRMAGPPFSVDDDEVRALYRRAAELERTQHRDAIDDRPDFRARGLEHLWVSRYRARKE
ncbi:MAG: thiopurine S-methyltransferase [Planctomycetota bacterium]